MQYFRVQFMGVLAAKPSVSEITSSQVVQFRFHSYIIDCGEGFQMVIQRYKIKRNTVKAILISHMHGDHVYGLPGFLTSMAIGGRVDPLQIIGPPGIQEWLENTLKLTYAHLPYVIQYIIFNSTSSQIYEDEYVTIDTIPLNHRVPACGFLITEKIFRPNIDVNKIVKFGLVREQIKALVRGEQTVTNDGNILTLEDISLPNRRRRAYAYVSDSAYSEEVIHNLSGRVTTLYHESTYIDVDNASAIKWGHSTALQAAAVARESGAEKLVLGHFSGKYESLDIFHREAASVFPNVTLAYPGLMLEV